MRRYGVVFAVSLTLLFGVAGAATAQASSRSQASRSVEDWAPSVQFGSSFVLPGVALATADLSLFKSDSRDPVSTGSSFTYTLNVFNNGPDAATNVIVTDTLPVGVTPVMVTPSQGTCDPPAATITCNLGSMPEFEEATVEIAVTAPNVTGEITNTASVSASEPDPNPSDNTASEDTTVVPPGADLSIFKVADPDPAPPSSELTYTLSVLNFGPDDATGVTATDTLPPEVTFVSASAGCTHSSGVVTCALGELAGNDSTEATITVATPPTPGTVSNTATVAGNETDPDTTNNEHTIETLIRDPADLGVTVSDSPDPITTGSTLTYTTVVTNAGPGDAPSVSMTQTLHRRTTFVSVTSTAGTCDGGSGTVSCDLGTINNGNSVTITITVTKNSPGVISSTAVVTGDVGDENPANDSETEFTNKPTALDLANAIAQTPGIVAGASFVAQPPKGLPHDVQTTSLGGFPTDASTYGILTSGDATLADTPNDSGSSGADDEGENVRGNTDFDVTILKVDLNVPVGLNCLSIDFRFLSDEYPEFVDTTLQRRVHRRARHLGLDDLGLRDHGAPQLRVRSGPQRDLDQRRRRRQHERGRSSRHDVRRRDAAPQRVNSDHVRRPQPLPLDLRPGRPGLRLGDLPRQAPSRNGRGGLMPDRRDRSLGFEDG